MAEPQETSNRATVALVDAKLDGLSQLVARGFSDMQRQLDAVALVPLSVTKLQADHASLTERVDDLERAAEGRGEWRRTNLPAFVISATAVLISIVVALIHLH